jgi:antitoxin ParD1/3/4
MARSVTLDKSLESFVQAQLDSGRYASASEVVRHALRLMEAREHQLAELDAALRSGLADVAAGRVQDADDVFDELDARYAHMGRTRGDA